MGRGPSPSSSSLSLELGIGDPWNILHWVRFLPRWMGLLIAPPSPWFASLRNLTCHPGGSAWGEHTKFKRSLLSPFVLPPLCTATSSSPSRCHE